MYTQIKCSTNGINKRNLSSFISFIFGFVNNELLNGVFVDAFNPGFCEGLIITFDELVFNTIALVFNVFLIVELLGDKFLLIAFLFLILFFGVNTILQLFESKIFSVRCLI